MSVGTLLGVAVIDLFENVLIVEFGIELLQQLAIVIEDKAIATMLFSIANLLNRRWNVRTAAGECSLSCLPSKMTACELFS